MTDQDVRDFLDRIATEEPFPFTDAEPIARRARRRAARTAVAGAIGVAAALAVLVWGVTAIRTAPVPSIPVDDERSVDLGIFGPAAGRIVYYESGDLWAVDPNAESPGSTLVQLDLGLDADRFASSTIPLGWSSDGTELLFLREDPTDDTFPYDRHLYILHADGTETRVVPEPVGGAAISLDGSRVVFAGDGDDDGLYVVDAEGGQPVRIANGEEPTISPDGTKIAYLGLPRSGCCVQTGREHVWVVDADGTDAQEILADEPALAEGADSLTWSPAGDRIALDGIHESQEAIYTFAPDGSKFTMVIPDGANPYWSPDGSAIAYIVPRGASTRGFSLADADGANVRTFDFAEPGPWHPGTPEEGAEATASRSASPSPQPSPSTPPSSSSPDPSTFTSTTNGISIMHPIGWQVRLATEPWDGDAFTFDAPGVDVIFDPARQDGLYLSVASAPLAGRSPGNWCCGDLWLGNAVCETGGNFGRITVDGAAATIRGCDGDGNRFQDHVVQVATATRGYVIYLHVADDPTLQATYDEAWFDALLETVELQ